MRRSCSRNSGRWQRKYDSVVTFNGRGFDVPFIYLRSALLNVPITKKNWLGYRYAVEPHCDLAEQLTFYSVGGQGGAARRFNLDFYCKVFGIGSPKSAGVTGNDVTTLMAEGKFREIAEYCLRDVRATVELYKSGRKGWLGLNEKISIDWNCFGNYCFCHYSFKQWLFPNPNPRDAFVQLIVNPIPNSVGLIHKEIS